MNEKQNEDSLNRMLADVQVKLDAEPSMFVKPKFLCDIGVFGSHSAAVHAIQDGAMAHIKVSPYRVLIEKQAVLDFLKSKFRSNNV